MNKLPLAFLGTVALLATPAAADDLIQPGQWKVTTNNLMNGASAPPQVRARCLSAEQTGDVSKTFGPVMSTVNSDCERAEDAVTGRKLKWHLQCKGQLDMDISGEFNFDTTSHYSATVITKAWMAGRLMNDMKTELEGERLGDCPS